jgi:hypothetical protein
VGVFLSDKRFLEKAPEKWMSACVYRRVKLINWAKSKNTVLYLAFVSKLNQENTDE